jgi:hypothetical protein
MYSSCRFYIDHLLLSGKRNSIVAMPWQPPIERPGPVLRAAVQGFDESVTRPVWRGFARNIGQELFASGGEPLVAARALRVPPSGT